MKLERIYNNDHKSTGEAFIAITSTKSQDEVEAVCDALDAKGWENNNTQCSEYGFGEWSLSYVIDLNDLKSFKEHYKLVKKAV